ncbi:MAG: NADPH-dependent FMN reductase [Acidimicrobiia bacterium]
MPRPTVLLVPGSLRAGSFTGRLLHAAGALLPDRYDVEPTDLVRPLPYYDADLDGPDAPAPVVTARRRVAQAAGLVVATPEYSGTIPGGLKNTLDWLTRPPREHVLVDKPVVVLGASPNSRGAAAAVDWLRSALARIGAVVIGDVVAVPDVLDHLDADGRPDAEVVARLRHAVEALVTIVDQNEALTPWS